MGSFRTPGTTPGQWHIKKDLLMDWESEKERAIKRAWHSRTSFVKLTKVNKETRREVDDFRVQHLRKHNGQNLPNLLYVFCCLQSMFLVLG